MARGFIFGWVEQGGHTVLTDGRVSTDKVQQSFPFANVSVFNVGTMVLATIFSTEAGAPQANPFVADSTGKWGFWADAGRYDVQFSGAGIATPYTLFNVETIIAQGTALVDPGSNGIVVRTALNTTVARSIEGTTSAIDVTNGNGVSGNPIIDLSDGLAFAGKTVSDGTFTNPSIPNFSSAQHNHEGAAGGGQLNATNVFSAGTVPILRLPAMVGATGILAGQSGLVPQPQAGDDSKFLRGDGSWQVAGGGGGGSPGGGNGTVQYNNAGAFGGTSGATSDGTNITFGSTNLRATRPRITTSIDDTNGNEVIGLLSVGSAVNEISISNAGTGAGPSITVTGGDANPNLNISAKGSGIIASASNLQISNNAPQMAFIDVNDSKTVRMSLNGANWDFTNDTLGTVPVRIDTTNNNITVSAGTGILEVVGGGIVRASGSNFVGLQINKTAATARFVSIVIDGNNLRFNNAAGGDFFTCSFTNEVTTFNQIPILPASDPTTDNQAVRTAYVNSRKIWWSMNWFIADPSTFPVNSFDLAQKVNIPFTAGAAQTFTATEIRVIYNTGSASGSFTISVRKHPFSDQSTQTTLGTLTVNPGSVGVGAANNIGDHLFAANDYVYVILDSISSPLQRNVTISLIGFQNPTS